MKYCPSCQHPNSDDTRFCTKCGTPLTAPHSNWNSQNQNASPMDYDNLTQVDGLNARPWQNQPNGPIPNQSIQNGSSANGWQNGQIPNGYSNPPRQQWQEMNPPYIPPAGPGPSMPEPKHNSAGKIVLIVLAIIALLAIGGLGGWFLFGRAGGSSDPEPVADSSDTSASDLLADVPSQSSEEESSEKPSSSAASGKPGTSASSEKPAPSAAPVTPNVKPDTHSIQPVPDIVETPKEKQYRLNYVMKVRNGPSLNHSQVSSLKDGTVITVLQEETADDDSVWGRIGPSQWVCLTGHGYTYASPKN